MTFFYVQKNQAIGMTDLVRSNLLETLGNSDFFSLGRSLSQLVNAGLIDCPDVELVHPVQRTILDSKTSPQCRTSRQISEFFLEGVNVDVSLVALNGDRYNIRFVMKNQPVFGWAVWGMRVLGVFGILGAFLLLRLQSKIDQLKVSSQLELAAAKHEIAQRLAHDIRSPVTALNLGMQVLPTELGEHRSIILEACRRIEAIASDLLVDSVSSPGTGPVFQNIDQEEIESLIREKRYQFAAQQIEFAMTLRMEEHAVSTDVPRHDLLRALSNLLNNAAEASSANSTVYLEIFSSDHFMNFRVTDSGIGIPEHLLAKLGSEKFTTKPNGGVGIGLYHLRKQFEAVGGELDIKSKVGVGTQVTLKVPMNPGS